MFKKYFFYFFLLLSVLFLNACNDSPSDIGDDLLAIDDVIVLNIDSATDSLIQTSNTYKKIENLGSASEIYLGKAENITSHILIQFVFALPDSIQEDLINNNINVLESWVELTKEYSFGDTLGTFEYEAFQVNQAWNSSTFTSDSLQYLSVGNVNLASNPSVENDSIYSFSLDNSVAQSWLLSNADTSLATNHGILISPTQSTQQVIGFTAYNISATNDAQLKIIVNKPGVYQDTIIGYVASDLSVIEGDVPTVSVGDISVQPGLAAHSKLYIDLSEIPKNTVINSAELTLTVDSAYTVTGSSYTNALRVYLFSDSASQEINTSYVYTLSRSGNTFTGVITNIVRAIASGVDNQGFLVKAYNDLSGLEIFAMKGSNATNYNQRPKLKIIYSGKK